MRLILTFSAIVLGLTVTAADAGDAQSLTYEMFEAAVPHIDLESCPTDLAQQDTFCRASIHHEEIHVFALPVRRSAVTARCIKFFFRKAPSMYVRTTSNASRLATTSR